MAETYRDFPGKFSQEDRMTAAELKKRIDGKLFSYGITDPENAAVEDIYRAIVYTLKDILIKNRSEYKKRVSASHAKKVCYLCMEFLIGRPLRNQLLNLGLYTPLTEVLASYGRSFDEIYVCEADPGLGSGGLGRLAACFLDSLTALDYPAVGYSLCYRNGYFRQKLFDGEQAELPDNWEKESGMWLIPHPEKSVTVRFGGQVSEKWENGRLKVITRDCDEVRAVPYDYLVAGPDTNSVNTLRLWRAFAVSLPTTQTMLSQGSYLAVRGEIGKAEEITRQLYPSDENDEGKLLRLTQQYFLVSASLQNMISEYFAENGTLADFENKIAIHINDTHPALCIPELMRILMDTYAYSWDDAWKIVTETVSYTNHTVLPEALECWRTELFKMKLPRIFMIVEEINRRFCADLWNLYPGDWDRISRMSLIGYGQVRMANLCVVGSHTVNGVSALHSDILKKTVFRDFYKYKPWKFTNVTNGVVHRRWLCYANPALSSLLTDCIGDGFYKDPEELKNFAKFSEDSGVLSALADVKKANKERFAVWAERRTGKKIDASSVFDVQIKRIHEYKRQLLNVLKILSIYNDILDDPNKEITPQTFIFGGKAASSYYFAKQIIKLIFYLGKELENNPLTREKIRVLFMEDYNISMAETLIPAAEISEQISLAGKEASGTSNMKLMMNGALTVGTLDGANVEIREAVGQENMFIFGLNTREADELWRVGYDSRDFYHRSETLRRVVDRFNHPIGGENFSGIADYLINGSHSVADPFMCLADFDAYRYAHAQALDRYVDKNAWNRSSLLNIAASGRFSSDISIQTYAKEIWHLSPVSK